MKLSRRAVLGGAALGGMGGLLLLPRTGGASADATAIDVKAAPIPDLLPTEPGRRRFGALSYRAGFVLTSGERNFGGLSGLWRSPDGSQLVSITDHGAWVTAIARSENGSLSALSDVRMAPILGAEGALFGIGRAADTEGLAIAEGIAFVSVERRNAVLRFEWARDGVAARGVPIPLPEEVKALPHNKGLEAIGVAPPAHPLAGSVVAVAERSREGDDAPTRGFVLTGPTQGAFDIARSSGFEITDLAFLPSGDMLLLERFYTRAEGVKARLRRVAANSIRPGATVDGPVLFEADRTHEIDNMEGLSIHVDRAGATILTMVSDDNFSASQRTTILEFELNA